MLKKSNKKLFATALLTFAILMCGILFSMDASAYTTPLWGDADFNPSSGTSLCRNDMTYNTTYNSDGSVRLTGNFSVDVSQGKYEYYQGYDSNHVGILRPANATIYLAFGATTEMNGITWARHYYDGSGNGQIDLNTNIYQGVVYTKARRTRKSWISYANTNWDTSIRETVTSTNYKDHWTYPLGTVSTATTTNAQTGSFDITLSASQINEINEWKKACGRSDIYLCVGMDRLRTGDAWSLRGDGVHGAVWWKCDGQDGAAYQLCDPTDYSGYTEGSGSTADSLSKTVGAYNATISDVASFTDMNGSAAAGDGYTQDRRECTLVNFAVAPVLLSDPTVTVYVENGTIKVNDVTKNSGDVTTVTRGSQAVVSYAPNGARDLLKVEVSYDNGANYTTYSGDQLATLGLLEHYVDTNIQKDLIVKAVFGPLKTVNLKVNTSHATAGINGTSSVNSDVTMGSNPYIQYSPEKNYKISSIIDNGVSKSFNENGGTYTISNIDTDHIVTITAVPKTYTVKVTVINGTAKFNSTAVSSGTSYTVNAGTNNTVTYEPRTGYHLQAVFIDGVNATSTHLSSAAFNDIQADHEIEITYTPQNALAEKFVYNTTHSMIDNSIVKAGEKLTYEIDIQNDTSLTRDYVITDSIPAHTTYVTDSINENGTYADGVCTWNFTLAPNESKIVAFAVTVNDDGKGLRIENIASYTEKAVSNTGEADITKETDPVRNFVLPDPVKTVTNALGKDIDKTIVAAGDELTYHIKVTNPAPLTKTFTVEDVIPAGLEIVSASDNGLIVGQTVTWNTSFAANATKTYDVTVKVSDDAQDKTVKNSAVARCKDTNMASVESNTVENYVLKAPEKEVSLYKDETQENIDTMVINDSELLTYRIHYKNPAPFDRSITITDKLPTTVTMATLKDVEKVQNGEALDSDSTDPSPVYAVDNGGAYDENTRTVTWTLTVPANESGTVSFHVISNQSAKGQIIKNTATLKVNSPDESNENNPTDESNEVVNPILNNPVKRSYRNDDEDITEKVIRDGEVIRYDITVTNPAEAAKDFKITDIIPDGTRIAYVEEDTDNLLEDGIAGSAFRISDSGAYDAESRMITWELNIAAGGKKTVSFYVVVLKTAQNETVTNKAKTYVDKAEIETKADDDTDDTDIFVLEDPKKVVLNTKESIEASTTENEKSSDEIDGIVKQAGDELVYYITFKNPAPKEMLAIVTDELPKDTEFIEADHSGSYNAATDEYINTNNAFSYDYNETTHTLKWNIPVAAKCQETAIVRVKIKDSAKGKTLINEASVWFDNTTKKTNKVKTPVMDDPTKDVFKNISGTSSDVSGNDVGPSISANEMPVTVGDSLTYTIRYTNPSKEEVKIAKIIDKLPAGVDFISADMEGVYDEATHTVTWFAIPTNPEETIALNIHVVVNKGAGSSTIANKALIKMDEAYVSTVTSNDKDPDTTNFVSEKKVYLPDGTDLHEKVIAESTEFTYEITYKNLSDKHERNYVITDKLPSAVEFISASADGTYDADTHTVTWDLTVPKDTEGSVKVNVKAKAVSVKGAIARNKGHIHIIDTEDNIDHEMDTNEVITNIIDNPVKMVLNDKEIDINDMPVSPLQTFRYAITYINPADEDKLATITDKLPAGVSFIEATDGGKFDATSNTVTWTDVKSEAHTRKFVYVTVQVNADATETVLENQATLSMDEATVNTNTRNPGDDPKDPSPSKDPFTQNYVVGKHAYHVNDKKELVNIDKQIVSEKDTIVYRISYANTADETRTFIITDTLTDELEYVSATGKPEVTGKTIKWTIEAAAGDSGYVELETKVAEGIKGKVISNTADITTTLPDDPDQPIDTPTNPTENYPFDPDNVKKTVKDANGSGLDYGVVSAKDIITYEISVKNPSPYKATLHVTDVLPKEVIYQSCDNGGTYDADKKQVDWVIDVEGNQSFAVTVTVQINEGFESKTIENKATVWTDTTTIPTNTTENYVLEKPVKEVKSGILGIDLNGKDVKAGDTVKFTISYNNPTPQKQTIIITDLVDKTIANAVQDISDGGTLKDSIITWTLKDVEPGKSGKVSFTIKVPELASDTVVTNKATVKLDNDKITGPKEVETNTVSITIKATDPNNNTVTIPKTGDSTFLYVIASGIAIVLAVGATILYKKKRR